MATNPVHRRLAAILAADVAGYSRLMGEDEEGTLAALTAHRVELIEPAIAEYRGRLVKTTGDGLLAEFARADDAVRCAAAVQAGMQARNTGVPLGRRIVFRVGINVGDVIVQDDDVFGDGVNVAARLEALAVPGGISVSARVHAEVAGRVAREVGVAFTDCGAHHVKNIARPITVFHWHPDPAAAARPAMAAGDRKPTLQLAPVEALGGAEPARVLAAGIDDAVASAMANLTGLAIVTSAEDANYAATARLQMVGERFRATVKLTDRRAREEVWSDRFDGDASDIFTTLDDLGLRISTTLRFEIAEHEAERSKARPIDELGTQELLSQAGGLLLTRRHAAYERAAELMERVLAREPDNFMALAIRAWSAMAEVVCGYREVAPDDGALALKLARRAVELNGRSDFAHVVLGDIHLLFERDIEACIRQSKRSLVLNPAYPLAMNQLGRALIYAGDADAGLAHLTKALGANPRFAGSRWFMADVALGHFAREAYAEAIEWARRADGAQPDVPGPLLMLIAALSHGAKTAMAAKEASRLVSICPDFRLDDLWRWPFRDATRWRHFVAGLATAGLPR